MAYATGSATTLDGLLSSVVTFLTTQAGYSSNLDSNVDANTRRVHLSKSAQHIELIASTDEAFNSGNTFSNGIMLYGATGYTAGSDPQDQPSSSASPVVICDANDDGVLGNIPLRAISYPIVYHLFYHSNPDFWMLLVNYDGTGWQILSGGLLTKTTTFTGGEYVAGTYGAINAYAQPYSASGAGFSNRGIGNSLTGSGSFFTSQAATGLYNAKVRVVGGGDATAADWIGNSNGPISSAAMGDLVENSISKPNNYTTMVPVQIFTNDYQPLGYIPHVNYVRVDNHQDGDILPVGSDRFFVVPWTDRTGSSTETDPGSSVYGLAIRYDGP